MPMLARKSKLIGAFRRAAQPGMQGGEGNQQGDEADNAYECGVAARLLRITRHSQSRNTYLVLLQGVSRVSVVRLLLPLPAHVGHPSAGRPH